ncbi:MAG: hypothetical protein EAZ75_09820 [Flavobacteriia bacterium]|nr:MAG: hypothetical protein EAZ75_09820 [Flavobacteriia bacterium]
MFKEILDGLTKILGPIATISKDRRELKDSALRAISTALEETFIYYRDLKKGVPKNLDREAMLAKYWSVAAIPIRHFDEQLALTCDHKAEYWLDPEKYDEKEVEDIDISLNSVRDAYRAQLSGNVSRARRGV